MAKDYEKSSGNVFADLGFVKMQSKFGAILCHLAVKILFFHFSTKGF